jgi:hypothetical protein
MNYQFRTIDCPDANGRIPAAGEPSYVLTFPTEDGGFLTVRLGDIGWKALLGMMSEVEEEGKK